MELRQGHHTVTTRFRSTLLSAALSGFWMVMMSPAVEAAVLQSKSYEYDAQGRVIVEKDAANTVLVTHTYDANGNRKTSTDALGRVTTNDYDALDRLKTVTVTANSVVQSVTQYGYDGRDNLTTVTDPRGLVTTYTYNGLDQLTAQASPDTGTTSYVPNAAGQVTARTNAANQATAYQYDALGRVTQASYADGRVVTYTYDQGTHGKGRLTGLSDSGSSLAWTYNADGNVLTRTQTIGTGQNAQSSTLTYAYNASGQLASLTMPSGAVIGYTYDDQGRVASLTRDAVTILSNIQYRPFGGITGWTWGNGQLHTRTYDQNGRLDLLSVGGTVHDLNYDIVSRIDDLADLADSSKNKDFSYDALDRLIGYTGQNSTRAWSYDAVGNRTAQSIGSTNETYSYASTSNRLQSLTNSSNSAQNRSYQYTSTGHTSSDGVNTFTYDARERLVSATTPSANASYTINPLGQRIKKSVTQGGATTTTTFLYDEAGHLVAETNSTGQGGEYVWLGDIPVAFRRNEPLQATAGWNQVIDPATPASGSWTVQSFANAVGGTAAWKQTIIGGKAGIIVDNNNVNNTAPNTATLSGGAWSTVTDNGDNYGGNLWRRSVTLSGGNFANFTANIPSAGTYEIYTYLHTQIGATATPAEYTVKGPSGASLGVVQIGQPQSSSDQSGWRLVGTYTLGTGLHTVSISDKKFAKGGDVLADAVLFAQPSAPVEVFNRAEWTPSLASAGIYNVQAWWPYEATASFTPSAQVWYTVDTAQGPVKVSKNQTQQGGQWVSLGQFTLDPVSAKVTLADEGAASKKVYADAVRFELVTPHPSGDLHYIHPDHLNTPRQLTTSDAQNTVVWRWDSEPFGSTLADADPDQNGQAIAFNLRFPGQYFDAETQLHYNYFRDYDPGTGRYIQSDPIGLDGGWNTFAYVEGNPISYVDPFGLSACGTDPKPQCPAPKRPTKKQMILYLFCRLLSKVDDDDSPGGGSPRPPRPRQPEPPPITAPPPQTPAPQVPPGVRIPERPSE